jgi:hypothetical protein
MEYTTMVLPSSLLEEEDELLSVRTLNDQPFARAPVPPYIVVARVTTVTWTKRQQLLSKQDMLMMVETLDFLPDCFRWDSVSLYLVLLGL